MAAIEQQNIISPGVGERARIGGMEATFKVAAEQTGGAFSMVEFVVAPRALVPPHVHENKNEVSYVTEGELGFMLGDEDISAPAGTTVMRPARIPHALWNASHAPARMVEVYSPGGFERYFLELARAFAGDEPPRMSELEELGRRFDVTLAPEHMARILETYGLDPLPIREG